MEEVRISFFVDNSFVSSNPQNLREDTAMDVDENEDGTQHVRRVLDYGIEVNFESLDDDEREVSCTLLRWTLALTVRHQDNSAGRAAEFDASIAKLTADIERMAPNMKAMERYNILLISDAHRSYILTD
jgi:structural maintenance of chromosome 1